MVKLKPLTVDIIVWIILMILCACVAFGLLQRDKQRNFGAVSYGTFPAFELKTPQGLPFNYHIMKSRVWAVHQSSSSFQAAKMAKRISEIEQSTASGKRHLYILTFAAGDPALLKALSSSHYIVVGESQDISSIFSFTRSMSDNDVILVDQNGVIRGQYDFEDVDQYRRFKRDLLSIL
jgi:hypothetical protein